MHSVLGETPEAQHEVSETKQDEDDPTGGQPDMAYGRRAGRGECPQLRLQQQHPRDSQGVRNQAEREGNPQCLGGQILESEEKKAGLYTEGIPEEDLQDVRGHPPVG